MNVIQNNTTFSLGDVTDIHATLPVGNYDLKYSDRQGYYLKRQADFNIPKKLYGDFSYIDRWLKSKSNAYKNLGILLSGHKGTGKTIAAQLFAKKANVPVIFITAPHQGSEFETFITSPIFKNAILFIDEFEKVYSRDNNPESLLTLMDGMYNTNLTFLLTVNDTNYISSKMKNRLNRIRYHRIFDFMNLEEILEIVNDKLINKQFISSFKDFYLKSPFVSMDILTVLIDEVNLFNESAIECAKYLNIVEESRYYKVQIKMKGTDQFYNCSSVRTSGMTGDLEIILDDANQLKNQALESGERHPILNYHYTDIPLEGKATKESDGTITVDYEDVIIVLKDFKERLTF